MDDLILLNMENGDEERIENSFWSLSTFFWFLRLLMSFLCSAFRFLRSIQAMVAATGSILVMSLTCFACFRSILVDFLIFFGNLEDLIPCFVARDIALFDDDAARESISEDTLSRIETDDFDDEFNHLSLRQLRLSEISS